MPDIEQQLISKAVQTDDLQNLISGGVQSRHFTDPVNEEVWEFLRSHTRQYKKNPSFETVKERFPDYEWNISAEPIEYLTHQFLRGVRRREAVLAFQDLATHLDQNDPDTMDHIEELFLDKARDLAQIIPSSNVSKFSQVQKRIELYKARKEAGLPVGMPYGIPKLDEITFGLQPHQYVTIAGWTGVGKSWLALLLAINHYRAGYTPMIISLEMDEEEIYGRLDSIATGIRSSHIKGNLLSEGELQRWEEYAESIEQLKQDIIIVDVDFATVDKVYAETARWSPDVVIVDYIQLMIAPNHFHTQWERIGYISQMLKAQARQMRIPIYGLAQANAESADEGAKLKNLAGSKDIGRNSDLVLALHQTEEDLAMDKMYIRIEKNRGGPAGPDYIIPMLWRPETGEFRPWSGKSDTYAKAHV